MKTLNLPVPFLRTTELTEEVKAAIEDAVTREIPPVDPKAIETLLAWINKLDTT